MRVLTVGNMFPPHHLGGYELMWQSSVAHLREAGHEVDVLTADFRVSDPDPSFVDEGVRRDLRWYWHEHEFPQLGLRSRLELERCNLATLRGQLEAAPPDVVAWWAMGGMSMSLIEWVGRHGPPAVGVVVDDWLVYGPQVDGWQRAFGRPVLRSVAERVTGVPTRLGLDGGARWVFVSETTRDRAAQGGDRFAGATIAHGGVDRALFPPVVPGQWSWRLLYLGRIDARKGIDVAVRALAELPADASLRVVGSGDEAHRREIEALVTELNLDGRVSFESHPRNRLGAIYAEADAVLFPVQWEEPWGLVPLEAMSVGRPVVATGTGGSGEYLRDGRNCVVYKPRDDPRALAAAVRRLADDPALRGTLREEGFRTAADHTDRRFNEAIATELKRAAGS